jgi:hypothetical protein
VIYLVLGLVFLGLLYGGRRVLAATQAALIAWTRRPLSYWRPISGLGAVVMLTLALALAVRDDWLPAAAFGLVAGIMAISARKRSAASKAGASFQAASPPTPASDMSERDARAMLGVDDRAGPEEIEAAYRRLIRRVHPDHGGAAGLAAQLNAARSRLKRIR